MLLQSPGVPMWIESFLVSVIVIQNWLYNVESGLAGGHIIHYQTFVFHVAEALYDSGIVV